nr:hypothetical protein [Oscillochloris trichoides]
MILEDILIKIPRLTTREQLLLLEAISRALRSDIETYATSTTKHDLSTQNKEDRAAFWASFGAWKQSPSEPTLEVLVTERYSKQEPPTL